MRIVPLEETFDMLKASFPGMDVDGLVKYRDKIVALIFWDIACCLVYPYKNGFMVYCVCLVEGWRHAGYIRKILTMLREMAGTRPLYAELCIPSWMKHILIKNGWSRVGINYVRPAGFGTDKRLNCDLMCSTADAKHLDFITELYEDGYRVKLPKLLSMYRSELKSH